jgi:ferredoxin
MKIAYDRTVCAGWFQCVQEWDAFSMEVVSGKADLAGAEETQDGVFVRDVPADKEAEAKAAVEQCPVDAIEILDE